MTKEEEGAQLVKEGWKQTSRKYRMIARIPEGYTAIEALKESDPKAAEDLLRRLNQWAANSFRRLGRPSDKFKDCFRELDEETFKAFRKAGGESSF